MFCADHPYPHEDCPDCRVTLKAMRPTVFAELAAAELRSGTVCCRGCEFVFFDAVDNCPRCLRPNPFRLDRVAAEEPDNATTALPVDDLASLTMRPLTPGR